MCALKGMNEDVGKRVDRRIYATVADFDLFWIYVAVAFQEKERWRRSDKNGD
jgi:hypothetical protein